MYRILGQCTSACGKAISLNMKLCICKKDTSVRRDVTFTQWIGSYVNWVARWICSIPHKVAFDTHVPGQHLNVVGTKKMYLVIPTGIVCWSVNIYMKQTCSAFYIQSDTGAYALHIYASSGIFCVNTIQAFWLAACWIVNAIVKHPKNTYFKGRPGEKIELPY